jgi:hypothetical protein
LFGTHTNPAGITITEVDNVAGGINDFHPGLGVFRVEFSDGTRGFLTVACRGDTSPDIVLESVTVTKEFVDYIFNPMGLTAYQVVPNEGDE